MPSSGLASSGLERLHAKLHAHVDRGDMPGLVALVARGPDVHVETIGTIAFGSAAPMRTDSIFRIASLTKPITAAATMCLVDDGTIGLETTVDALLPELADRRVLRSLGSQLDETVPARREITVEDLLSFRFGFGVVMVAPDTYPIQTAEAELQLATLGPPWPPTPHDPDAWIANFGTLPLMYQPGERWMYNTGAQVLGVLIERAAEQPLEGFMRDRIFEPLEMRDTSFHVPAKKLDRFTSAYTPDPETSTLSLHDAPDNSYWRSPPALPNAAGWLVSTLDDFWAFVQMLRSGGTARDRRILSEESVRLMTTDRLTDAQREANTLFLGPGGGWGLGMAAPGPERRRGQASGYGWEGGSGTVWRTDPATGLSGILFTQREMTSPEPPEVFGDFWEAAYGAIG